MEYDIHGTILTDPIITIREVTRKIDEGITLVDCLIEDSTDDDSIGFIVIDESVPTGWDLSDLNVWVLEQLKQYEV